jgi:hypothetical protein
VKNNVRYPGRSAGYRLEEATARRFRLSSGGNLGCDDVVFSMTISNLLFLHRDPMYYIYIPDFGCYGLDVEIIPSITAATASGFRNMRNIYQHNYLPVLHFMRFS